ncbi:MAG TPA: FxLYD domain-containing protein, partial [Nitrososphaeraceae archaeon]|nr:FxLYD domain-containing protein [Nitrososphaeraceae archaeon]
MQASEVNSAYHANKDYTTFHLIQVQANTSSSNNAAFKPQQDLILIKSPSSSYIDRSGILHITGEVQNNFGFPVQSVQVTATLYGSQKNVIDRKSVYTYIDQLKSGGGRSGFNIIVPANVTKNSTGYSLSAKSDTKAAAAALSPKPASLNLNLNKGTKDLNGNYHLLGNVTNKGNNTATHVRV